MFAGFPSFEDLMKRKQLKKPPKSCAHCGA